MLRNISLFAFVVFVSVLMLGFQSRSSAQIAISNSWAGVGGSPALICGVQGAPGATETGFAGVFGVSGPSFSAQGDVYMIYNSKDAAGNLSSITTGIGYYTPTGGRATPANFILSMRKMANGTMWEGFSATNYLTGAPLYTTGITRDGSPYMLPVMRGTITIGM